VRCEHVSPNLQRRPHTAYPGSVFCWRHMFAHTGRRACPVKELLEEDGRRSRARPGAFHP
jgi:hypothetical protein